MAAEIRCVWGDVAAQSDCDVTVSVVNHPLASGDRGVIFHDTSRACGLENPVISWGDAAIGMDEAQAWVIHVVWPRFCREQDLCKLLADSYRNCVMLAEKHQQKSLALPSWESNDLYRMPVYESSMLTIQTLRECLPNLKHLQEIRLVCRDDNLRRAYQLALDNL